MINCHKTSISNAPNYYGEGDENEVKMNSAVWNTKERISNQMESWLTTRISFQPEDLCETSWESSLRRN